MAYRKAFVYVCNQYAGLLEETDAGYSFAYDKYYLASCFDQTSWAGK